MYCRGGCYERRGGREYDLICLGWSRIHGDRVGGRDDILVSDAGEVEQLTDVCSIVHNLGNTGVLEMLQVLQSQLLE